MISELSLQILGMTGINGGYPDEESNIAVKIPWARNFRISVSALEGKWLETYGHESSHSKFQELEQKYPSIP